MTNITGDLSSGLPAIQVIYHFNNESWCGIYLSYHHYMIRLSHNGVGKTLAAFTENQAINLNRNIRNSFSIATTAGKTTLSANGQPIISFNNENLDHDGPIKIGVGFTKANQTIVVEFDSIVVKSNP